MNRKVLIAAGGSGGHLLPAQQLAELLQKNHAAQIVFAGYKLDKTPFFRRDSFRFHEVCSAPIGRNPFHFLRMMGRGFWSALEMIRKEKPDLVVGFGSYHTVPVLLAAALTGKKIVLYEANRIMGKVNRLFSPFAKAIAIQLPLQHKKAVAVPLFPWIQNLDLPEKDEARKAYGLESDRFTVLVFGGSQGASFLNETMPSALSKDTQVIHLAGSEEAAATVRERYRAAGIRAAVKGYESNMALAYSVSDLAVCRSGAGTTAELIRHQLPAFLIPYPFAAEDHQTVNARYLESLGGARWMAQSEATAEKIRKEIGSLDLATMRLALAKQKEQHSAPTDFDQLVAQCGGWK